MSLQWQNSETQVMNGGKSVSMHMPNIGHSHLSSQTLSKPESS